jgi:hypothetical protein
VTSVVPMHNDSLDNGRGPVFKQQKQEEAAPPSWQSEEPAPVDFVTFGQNLAAIMAKAMKASWWGRRHR